MPAYGAEPSAAGGPRQGTLAVVFLVVALAATYVPDTVQQRVASTLRTTALRPFIATQERLADARLRAAQVEILRDQVDSLAAVLSTQGALVDENRALRSLLGLTERIGTSYRPATVLRPGTQGSESMFLLFLGSRDGIMEGAPVVNRSGLVGVIREVRERSSVGMDWTHPDFRASAMVADGSAYGIVENRRGEFREDDRLVLTGGAYHEQIPRGSAVLTSGLGGVFPRGIPIGRIEDVAEVEGRWRKTYWLRPFVEPGSVTHALVAVGEGTPDDMSMAFPPDSFFAEAEANVRARAQDERIRVLEDSVRLLRAILEESGRRPPGGRP